jgi:hypothetical protein
MKDSQLFIRAGAGLISTDLRHGSLAIRFHGTDGVLGTGQGMWREERNNLKRREMNECVNGDWKAKRREEVDGLMVDRWNAGKKQTG